MIKECKFCHQEKQHYAKGYCRPCYARFIKRGAPEYFKPLTEEEIKQKNRDRSNNYRKKHRKKCILLSKKWSERNKERIQKYKKEWYLKNREKILEKIKKKKKFRKGSRVNERK